MLNTKILPQSDLGAMILPDVETKLTRKRKLHGRFVKTILDKTTRKEVGWLYEWNNGVRTSMWKDGPKTDVIYE